MDPIYRSVYGIHGVPRSGTSWLAQIINSHPLVKLKFQPLFSYALKDCINETSSIEAIRDFYNMMWHNDSDLLLNMKDPLIHANYPVFSKTEPQEILVFKQVHHHFILKNLMIKDPDFKLIGILRNPLSVLASWKNAPREFAHGWNFELEWLDAPMKNKGMKENYFGFEKWKEFSRIVLELENVYPERVYIVDYSRLVSNTLHEVKQLFNFMKIGGLSEHTLKFIEQSTSVNHLDHNSVFKVKSKDDGWKGLIPITIAAEIKHDVELLRINERFHWFD